MQYYHRVGTLYCEALQAYLAALEPPQGEETEYERHVQDLHMIFHLARVLYVPEDGSGLGVVGEELMHWLNAHDVAPTTEQGQQIAQTIPPHQHPDYWDYILRCILRGFFGTGATVLQSYVNDTASPTLQAIAAETVHMLQTVPRSTAYTTEQAFLSAHRHWHTSIRVFLSSFQRKMDVVESELSHTSSSANDMRLELEAQFRCLYELLCGVEDRVLEFSEDWKEALCAWGLLVLPAMKRDDVPEVVYHITHTLHMDETLPRECILSHITRGELIKCVKLCIPFDEWLATHMGDFFDKAQLLDTAEPTMMDEILLTWADTLVKEERLWRMSLSYLNAIHSETARSKMRSILFHVPLLSETNDDEHTHSECDFQKVEEVLGACIEYGMEDEVRLICRKLARELMDRHKYGLAIAYSVRARDARQVQVIADRMLHDYVTHDPAYYIASVDSVPRTLLDNVASMNGDAHTHGTDNDNESDIDVDVAATATTPFTTTSSIFSRSTFAPLVFHVKYRDFHQLFSQQDTWREAARVLVGLLTSEATPESFLSVLLVDALPFLQSTTDLYFSLPETYELLRITEKVMSVTDTQNSEQAADFYFYWLEQLLANQTASSPSVGDTSPAPKRRRELAHERMLVVRLALAQYISRITMEPGAGSIHSSLIFVP